MNQNEITSKEKENVMLPDYKSEIASIIRGNLAPKPLQERLMEFHENDLAAALALLEKEERRKLYGILDAETLAAILEYSDSIHFYLDEIGTRKKLAVLSALDPPVAAAYLSRLGKEERNTLLELLDKEVRQEISVSLSFDGDEIGSHMTSNYICIHTGISVKQAMKELVAQAAENDNIATIYVVDGDGTFFGAIDLKELIIARETAPLASVIMTSYPYVYANELIENCIDRIRGYSEDSLPVLDSDNKLLGVLTAQDVTELVGAEMGDDYAKLAGLTAEEDLREPLSRSIAKRLPWLIVLLILGMLVSAVVGLFEPVVAQLALVVCFQSLVLDMAGNVGTQSLAVTIRVLTDEQITGKQKLFLVAKESRIGLLNGLILGVLSFVLIGGYLTLLKGQPPALAFSVSLCTGSALLLAMLLAGIFGTVIPLLFKKLRIDPAVASGPLITTVNDLVAVVTYYGLAWLFLLQLPQL